MSLLDDARRLVECDPNGGQYVDQYCIACRGYLGLGGSQHAPDCPWLNLPKIVAALEAAGRLAATDPIIDKYAQGDYSSCWVCEGEPIPYPRQHNDTHTADCPHQALVAALKGEVPA